MPLLTPRTKAGKLQKRPATGFQDLDCECGRLVEFVGQEAVRVICSYCVMKMIAPPDFPEKPEEQRPRGWHKKQLYISPSGKRYRYGRQIDESPASNKGGLERDDDDSKTT